MKPKAYKLRVPEEVVELIRGMHPELKKKMRTALASMLDNPYEGKVLKDELEGLRSFRIRRIRIIYRIAKKNQIEILAIGPRKSIYEETYRIISREERTLGR